MQLPGHMEDRFNAMQGLLMYRNYWYKEGIKEGLRRLEKARGWLTRQPDRKWQKEVRGWVDNLIKELNEMIDSLEIKRLRVSGEEESDG